ncbi:MAG: hypothetical protein PUD59_02395 [bacterium]|nr:hypothetical protein [bacterium]
MEKTIAETFKEKNAEILKNKMLLDLNNNDDSLKLTLKNKISLLCIKFSQRINNFLKENNIDSYEFKKISEIFIEFSNELEKFVLKITTNRKEYIKKYIFETKLIDLEMLNNEIDETVKISKSEIDIIINEMIYIDLSDNINKNVDFNEEYQKEELIDKLKKFDTEISNSIINSIEERNKSLKNVLLETKNKVDELNIKTSIKFDKK